MWLVETTDRFDNWFDALDDTDRTNVLACVYGSSGARSYASKTLCRYSVWFLF